jgi:hypothetical protein
MATLHSDLDKSAVSERVDLRYTKIPFTVLFAEARFQQESIGQFEDQVSTPFPLNDFLRNTDASDDLKDFRIGLNTSPWRSFSFNTHYRHSENENHYTHRKDSSPDTGYSAFIRFLGRSTDEVEAKLAFHLATWIKTTLGLKWLQTYYQTATDLATQQLPGDITPGDRLQAGTYRAVIPSWNLALTPLQRLYVFTTFSYQNSRTAAMANNNPSIVPYRGHVYSALSSATLALNVKTDLRFSYAFSHADYGQNNFAFGLPVGMVYQRHWVQAGLARRITKNVASNLQYSFSLYREPSSGKFNNYTAHTLFASLILNWP